MAGLYRVRFEKVAELTEQEAEAVLDHSEVVDDPTGGERFVTLDFDDDDPEMKEIVENFRSSVSSGVFEAVKRIAEESGSFILVG